MQPKQSNIILVTINKARYLILAPYVRNTETNNEMYKQNKTFAGKPMAQHTVYGRLKYLSIGRILGFSIAKN